MENMRSVSMKNLDNFGINPYAIRLLVQSYKERVAPSPVRIDYYQVAEEVDNEKILTKAPERDVEVYLSTPGYLGTKRGNIKDLDARGVRDTCRSYYRYLCPRPASFIFDGVEIHIRSHEMSDSTVANIARNIVSPGEKAPKKILTSKS